MPPAITSLPPSHTTATLVRFMISIISGIIETMMRMADRPAFFKSPLAASNLSCSKSSRTKDFTTRTAVRFSWMSVFSASSFDCIRVNRGYAARITSACTISSSGSVTASTRARPGSISIVITSAPISIPGERRNMRSSMFTKFISCVTSLVIRVTSDPVEKRSMFSKENF